MKKIISFLFVLYFTSLSFNVFSQCSYNIDMQDSFGDGWNGASIDVFINGSLTTNLTIATGSSGSGSFSTYTNDLVEFSFNSGSWDSEITFQIYDPSGSQIGNYGPNPQLGLFLTDSSNSTCPAPSCLPPSNFSASNITGNSADISWSAGTNAISYNIQYGNSGFILGNGNNASSGTGNYSITGLSPSSAYEVYIQADCGSGDTSTWAGPFSFSTSLQGAGNLNCTSGFPGAAYVDNLESQGLWSGDFGTGNGIWQLNSGTTSSFGTGPSGAHSGLNYFYYETSTGGGNSGAIVSTSIDLSSAASDAELSFWMHAYGSAIGTLDVGLATSPSGPFTTIFTSTGQIQTAETDPYVNVGVNIASYIGQTIYLQFNYTRGTTGTSFEGDIAIDLIEILSCFNCPGPSNVLAFNTTGYATDITWNPSGAESSWNIWYHPIGSALGASTTVTNDTVSLTNLTPVTTYEFYVQANCSTDSSILVGPYFFTTPCAALSPPQLQDFSSGFPPNACWDEADNGDPGTGPSGLGSGTWITDGFANIGTTGAVRIYLYGTAQSDWILSPQYDISTGGPYQVELDFGIFNLSSSAPGQLGSDDRVELLISDDGGASWIPLTNWNSSYVTAPNGNHEIISIANFTGIVQFGIWATDGSVDDPETIDVMVDNFEVKQIPACPQPLYLLGSNITGDSATITWNPGGSETLWNIQWGTAGFNLGSGNIDTTSNPSYGIDSLSPSTAYDFYVQAICGSGDSSIWSGPYTFNTLIQGPSGVDCSAGSGNAGIVFLDDLEIQGGWTGDFGTGNGFWRVNSGGTTSSGTGPSSSHSGNSYFYFESSTGGPTRGTIVSPLIDLAFAANDAELSFWIHAYGATMGTLSVGISNNQAGPFNTIFTNTGEIQTSNNDPYQNVGIDLSNYIGQQIYLSMDYIMGSSYTGDIAIDLIEVQSCLSCPSPSGLTLNSITADSANISWVSNPNDSTWIVYAVPASSSLANTNPLTVFNDTVDLLLNPSTSYNIYVQSICSSGDTSILAGPLSIITPCSVTPSPYFTNMDNNFPICWVQETTGDMFDWTLNSGTTTSSSTGPSDDMTGGGSYIYIETSSPRTQGDSAIVYSPLIDLSTLNVAELRFFNHMYGATIGALNVAISDNGGASYNTIFTKSGDQGDIWNEELITLGNYTGTVLFKITAIVGSSFTGDIAIDNFEIREAPTCPQPFNLNVINLFSDSVDLTWSAGLNETQWQVYLVSDTTTIGNVSPVIVNNDTSTFAIGPNSTYSFYVQGICGPGDTSLISGPFTFNSPCVSFVSFPYLEDFSSWPPLCWDLTGGTSTCIHYNNSAAEGSFWSWSSGQNALMTSPVFDVSTMSSPELIFDWSHLYNTSYPNDALEVLISDDGGTTWSQIWYKSGQDLESNDGATISDAGSFISSGRINLSTYGNSIMIRFNFISGFGPDCFIDNVEIKEAPMNDIGISNGDVPNGDNACTLGISDIIVTIQNFGAAAQSGFNIDYSINGVPYIETIYDTIMGGSSLIYTLSNPIDMTADGTYDLTFSTNLNNDSDNSNDSFGPLSFENFYSPIAPTANKDTFCISPPFTDSFTLNASGPTGVTIEWFDSINGNSMGSGNSIVVYPDSARSYWAAYKDFTAGNIGRNDINNGGFYNFYGEGLILEVYNTISLDSVTVYPADTGFVEILLYDIIGSPLYTDLYHISIPPSSNQGVKIPIGISVPPGFYTMNAGNATTTNGLFRNTGGSSYPYNYGSDASITGPTDGNNAFYYFFYNWDISTESCYSDFKEFIFEDCTNITEKDKINFDIIPNPNNGVFNIIFEKTMNGLSKINIYDIGGKIIYNKDITSNDNKINLSNIEKGIYLITVENNLHKTVKRIIVQ